MNAPKCWLTLSAAVLFLAACGTNSTATTGGNGSGNPSGSAGTGATGGSGVTGGSNGSGSGANGTTTGVEPPQDPIGTKCSQKGNGDYASCSTSADCQCPLLCALDYTFGADDGGGSICTIPCTQDSQCPDAWTHCDAHGLCTTNICEADGGSDETPFFGPCDAAGTGDGTCEPEADKFPHHAGNIIGVCFQAGTAAPGAACDMTYPPFTEANVMNTKRPAGVALCPVGYECNPNGQCQQLCDPSFIAASDNDGGGCDGDLSCVVLGHNTRFGGACQAVGDGGCTIGQGSPELGDCTLTSDCECPLSCETDVSSEIHSCEKVCSDTATDCDVPFTTCQKSIFNALHFCNYNFCAQSYFGELFRPDGGGGFGSACNYLGSGDGSCQLEYAVTQAGLLNTFGFCVPGTVATGGACAAPGDVSAPYCVQGDVCVPFNSGSLCEPPCDPVPDGGTTGCKDGDGCFSWIPLVNYAGTALPQVTGFCQACSAATVGCQNSSECCDGFCDYNADAGAGACN